jgi:hypothetical protein
MPRLRGRSHFGAAKARCSAAGLDFRTNPAGFNPLRQRLRGECPARFRVATTGISNRVYDFPHFKEGSIHS